jgi:polyhydroxyalkanoate synthesis regulator phasin
MFERLERLILLQIGAAAATRERVEEVVNRLIEQGRWNVKRGARLSRTY